MARRKRIQPDIKVIAVSRLHIINMCMVLLIILNFPYGSQKVVLKLSLPSNSYTTKPGKMFSMAQITNIWKKEKRKFILYNLSGNIDFDNLTLCAVEYATRQLKVDNNITDIVRVHLTSESTYGQFVQLNNIMKVQGLSSYIYNADEFYIWLAERW